MELGPVLVFCSQPNFVEAVSKSLQKRLFYANLRKESIPYYISIEHPTRSLRIAEQWLGGEHLVTRLLKDGIAIHHGDLPEALRKSIETDFRERKFGVIIATNTLAQGVNLPIRTVIIHSCRRYTSENNYERIPSRDYWNIAGRAGRAGEETEGTVIHIINAENEMDVNDVRYYLKQRSALDPIKSALFKFLNDLVNERLSETAIYDKLDSEVLALLVEEGVDNDVSNKIRAFLSETLANQQVIRYHKKLNPLTDAFVSTANAIMYKTDSKYWPVYSATGLSASSYEQIKMYIDENNEQLLALLKNCSQNTVYDLIDIVLEITLELKEMRPEKEFSGSYQELLRGWLSGANVYELATQLDTDTKPDDLAKFIEELFGYLLPWGIYGFIRIALSILHLDNNDISDYAKFLPSMVKFGLPSPATCWAMISGIPFRSNAIEVSSKYTTEVNDINYKNFLEWIAKMDYGPLSNDYNLKSPILEDVSKSLLKAGANPLTQERPQDD